MEYSYEVKHRHYGIIVEIELRAVDSTGCFQPGLAKELVWGGCVRLKDITFNLKKGDNIIAKIQRDDDSELKRTVQKIKKEAESELTKTIDEYLKLEKMLKIHEERDQ